MGAEGVKPKKKWGQHFLTDGNIARKIVAALGAGQEDTVVEIGPGMGVLTRLLVPACRQVIAVEYDAEAVQYLKSEFAGSNLIIHHADVLRWDPEAHLTQPALFIGNLPYNISSQIFFRLIRYRALAQRGVFMVQKEVAQRICAPHGNKDYGILSVLLGYYFDLRYEFSVSDKVFFPRPKVQSAVFSMRLKTSGDLLHEQHFAPVVKAAFAQRRKTLRNALRAAGADISRVPEHTLALRAEQLSIAAFEELAHLTGIIHTPHIPEADE